MGYNTNLEDRIDHFFISNEALTKKKQMGGVGWLVNGNMCCGIYEDLLVVRTQPTLVDKLIKEDGIHLFSNQKENRKPFLSIIRDIYKNEEALHKFLLNSHKYTADLPPKSREYPDK